MVLLCCDAIGSALGANQINNGPSGPRLPFVKNNNRDTSRFSSLVYQESPSPSQRYDSYANYDDGRNSPGRVVAMTQLPCLVEALPIEPIKENAKSREGHDERQEKQEP
jgi:hypothetical protein